MSEPIEIKIDDDELNNLLNKLSSKAVNAAPLMKNIAGILEYSVEENFEHEGRPKWDKLSNTTIKQRSKKGRSPGKILQMQGELATSVTSSYDSNSSAVGTNKVYAAIHQFGGYAGRAKKVRVQAQPFLSLGDEEIDEIRRVVGRYLNF